MAGNELATAYLALVPSLKGAQKSIEQQLNGIDTTRSGEKMGEKMGDGASKKAGAKLKSGLGAAAKTAGAVAAAAFAGAFTIGKQSLDAYASYEQLAGGVEKIFDDMDNSAIFADAAEAYKTLNLSANDYLETINDVGANFASTMGDKAGYETAKKGLTAISDFASGTGKNLDVLKDKFGMITRSTSSYQSIADQFGGVLPATSAAFLEQAQAAGFLSDSYGKLTEVPIDEYQQAIAAMLEKGVADLGLAGNTAAETANTISGSLAAVSGAWANWLAGLANENANVTELTNQLVDSVIVAASNVIPRMGVIMTSLGTVIHDNLMNLLSNLIEQLHSNGPATMEAALDMLLNIVTAINEVITLAVDALVLLLASLVVAIVNKGVEFYNSAVVVMGEMAQGIASGASFVLSEIERGITDGVNKVKGMASDFVEAGKDLVRGIADGISGAVDWVLDAINSLCTNALDTVKDFFGIASPSKLMRKMFGYVGEGAALGILDSAGSVVGAMESMAADAFSVVSNAAKPTLSMSASLSSASLGGSYEAARSTTNNQTINIYQPVKSAAETARVMRMQSTYGLAGAR